MGSGVIRTIDPLTSLSDGYPRFVKCSDDQDFLGAMRADCPPELWDSL